MKLELDKIMAAANLPWDFQVVLTSGAQCKTREPTPDEVKAILSSDSIKGGDAVKLLAGVLQIAPAELEKCSPGELRAAFTAYAHYHFEREQKRVISAVDGAVAAVRGNFNPAK